MYDEAQQFLATEIARLCNIPAYMVSAEANNSMTYANVLDERKQFYSRYLLRLMSMQFKTVFQWMTSLLAVTLCALMWIRHS